MNPEEFLKHHPSLSKVKLNVENKLVWIDDIHETQIDKQRVKEAIDKIFNIDDHEDEVNNKMIKKELGIE